MRNSHQVFTPPPPPSPSPDFHSRLKTFPNIPHSHPNCPAQLAKHLPPGADSLKFQSAPSHRPSPTPKCAKFPNEPITTVPIPPRPPNGTRFQESPPHPCRCSPCGVEVPPQNLTVVSPCPVFGVVHAPAPASPLPLRIPRASPLSQRRPHRFPRNPRRRPYCLRTTEILTHPLPR
jgi:hypothetical protein